MGTFDWPTRSDGRPKKFGELTPEQKVRAVKAAVDVIANDREFLEAIANAIGDPPERKPKGMVHYI